VRPTAKRTYNCNSNTNRIRSVGSDIVVRLKWGETEYRGRLVSVDSYMNIQMSECVEFIEGKNKGTLGQVLIRCVHDKNGWPRQQLSGTIEGAGIERLLTPDQV